MPKKLPVFEKAQTKAQMGGGALAWLSDVGRKLGL